VGIFIFGPLDKTEISETEAVGVYYHRLLWFKSMNKRLSKKGYKVYAWTVNSQRSMQRLIELNIDGIITDHPDLLASTIGH